MKALHTLTLTNPAAHVALLTLNRPDNANSINTEMARELEQFFGGWTAWQEDYRCIVLTGAGGRIFCAGGDLKERNSMNDEEWAAQHAIIERAILNLFDCPIPVIAAVNGVAVGGGCELALSCDFIYAAEKAVFALPETGIGIIPGAGGTQTLLRAVGLRRAKELIFTGRKFSAAEALEWGMLAAVVEEAQLLPTVLEVATTIAGNAPLAVRQAKKAITHGAQMDFRTALYFAVEAYDRLVPTQDRYEGVRAFNEKRRPDFKGR